MDGKCLHVAIEGQAIQTPATLHRLGKSRGAVEYVKLIRLQEVVNGVRRFDKLAHAT